MKKKWSELSPKYRKELERKGVNRVIHERKGVWKSLSRDTLTRYQRYGITPEIYESGANLKAVMRGEFDEVRNPNDKDAPKYKTIKWFDNRVTWLKTRSEGIDSAKWPPNVPPWWIIFS